MNMTA